MPYTSGTTGHPKGCMHTHRSTMYNTVASGVWGQTNQGAVGLAVLPMFHVTGMQANLNGTVFNGSTVVLLPRWDRDAAAHCVQRHGITSMALITAMVIDFMANPRLKDHDLSSLRRIAGGGAAMPKAVALEMERQLGLKYGEGYGMSETMAATHSKSARPAQGNNAWACRSSMSTRAWSTRSRWPNCRQARPARSSCTARR